MLRVLRRGAHEFAPIAPDADGRAPADAVWIDLVSPTREEELAIEGALGVELPTREEMAHLEPSSRLYQDDGATFMTVTLLGHAQTEQPRAEPVTFALVKGILVTIRYHELKAFEIFAGRVCAQPDLAVGGGAAMLGLLEAVVERLAEILDKTSDRVEEAARGIFDRPRGGAFAPILGELASNQSIDAKVRDSLVTLGRLVAFAPQATEMAGAAEHARLAALAHDVQSLTEHVSYQAAHIGFLLDAALGLINIEQNSIIKIFSVAAVVFLPPTLVASVYGMNFQHMPELRWLFGYPWALGLMVVSMLIPLWFFRRKGWL